MTDFVLLLKAHGVHKARLAVLRNLKVFEKALDLAGCSENEILGNVGKLPPSVTIFDIKTSTFSEKQIPGKIVEDEIVPFEDMLIYFTHEENRSFLYIIDKESTEIITKIQVPKRKPGIHTTLLD